MRVISIANQKGGCGKTTTSINLGAALAMNGRRTLLLDLDPQAHASLGLNFENQDSIYNVISKLTPRKLAIEDIIQRADMNFDIVPSNVLVGTLEQELADEIGREIKLVKVLEKIKDRYDYIIIDCPPSLGFLTINALRASSEVYVPVETSRFSMQGVEHLLDITHLIRDRLNHQVDHRILITMFDSRLRHSFSMLAKLRDRFGEELFDTIVHVNVKLKESAVMGQTVVNYDKYCRGSKDYISLAKEIIMQEKPQDRAAVPEPAPKVQTQAVQAVQAAPKEKEKVDAAPTEEFQPMSERMQKMVKKEAADMLVTRFSLDAPEAQSVYVTGSFNDWSLDESCRMRAHNGVWSVEIPLKNGLYKYQFIVDGRWQEDPANPNQERNSFGDINSLLEVAAHAQG